MRTAPLRLARAVPLAPIQPGAKVLVLLDCTDSTADVRFHGACGEVVGLIFDDPPSQYPNRPMLEVSVEGLGCEYFFVNELQLLH